MQLIDAADDTVNILFMGEEMLLKLLKDIAAVIYHIVPAKPVKFHDRISEFSTTRNSPSSEYLKPVVFHDQSKLGTVPGQAFNNFLFVLCRFQVGWGKFILDVCIEVHGQIRQMAENIVEHIWFWREFNLIARAQIIGDQENALRKLFIPVIGNGVTDSRSLNPPSSARADALIQVRDCGNMAWIELQQFQPLFEFVTDLLE